MLLDTDLLSVSPTYSEYGDVLELHCVGIAGQVALDNLLICKGSRVL